MLYTMGVVIVGCSLVVSGALAENLLNNFLLKKVLNC